MILLDTISKLCGFPWETFVEVMTMRPYHYAGSDVNEEIE